MPNLFSRESAEYPDPALSAGRPRATMIAGRDTSPDAIPEHPRPGVQKGKIRNRRTTKTMKYVAIITYTTNVKVGTTVTAEDRIAAWEKLLRAFDGGGCADAYGV